MHSILVLLSILAGVAGFFFLSEATTGVGIIAIAVLLAAWGRIAQANKHHEEIKKLIGTPKEE